VRRRRLSEEDRIQLALREWADEARRGRDAAFREWTFFETNCFSELIKLYRDGHADSVHAFLEDRYVLLPSTVLAELSKVPQLARVTPQVFATAHLYLVSTTTDFWRCDLWNFINTDGHPRNVLETYPVPPGVFDRLHSYRPFQQAVKRSRKRIEKEYPERVQPDVGAQLDERELVATIWHRIDRESRDWLNLEIPAADARPDRFPTFFVYYYTYYFRYIKARDVRIQLNDFNDLGNIIAAPYCTDFFTERTFAGILKNDVQGRVPPRPIETARRLHKKGFVDESALARANATTDQTYANDALLQDTRIWTINDLREQVEAA